MIKYQMTITFPNSDEISICELPDQGYEKVKKKLEKSGFTAFNKISSSEEIYIDISKANRVVFEKTEEIDDGLNTRK